MSPAVPAALLPYQTFPELSHCLLPGVCRQGRLGRGEENTCVWFQVWLKSLMRLTTGCFKDNQLQCLLREGDIWGLGFLFVWFVVLKWRDVNSPLKQQSMCFQASVGQLYCLRALSLASYSFEYIQMRRETLPGCPPGQKASHTVQAECLLHH